MQATIHPQSLKYFLEPGHLYIATHPTLISTVLGSCVSVCLWDSKKKLGGINHFFLPGRSVEENTTRFGTVAVRLLIKMLLEEGALKHHLKAQLFGGAKPIRNISMRVGEENVKVARKILIHYGIPIISEDVGGNLGRKIIFNTFNGEVAVVKVKSIQQTDWRKVK